MTDIKLNDGFQKRDALGANWNLPCWSRLFR